jgi:PAS domain S-box-containing protein
MVDNDMSELKKFASAMSALMANSTDYILVCGRDAKPVYFNKAYAEIMKKALGLEMVPGLVPHKLLSDPEAIKFWDSLHARVLSGETFRVEFTHHFQAEKDVRYFESNFTPIRESNGVNGFIEISRDITERKRTEAQLANKENLLNSLANTVEDSIFCKDSDRRYIFVNKAMANLFGCSESDLIGKTPEEIFDPDSAAIIKEVDDRTFSGEKVSEIRKLNIGGKIFSFHTVQMPMVVEEEKVISINGIVRDVTRNILDQEEKLNLEAKLRQAVKMQAVGTMAGGIAHEFNNLLSVIMGCAELARTEVPEDSFVRYQLNNLLKASHRVKDLVKQILTFSRKGQQKKRSCMLHTVIRESLQLVQPSIPASVDIKVDIDRKSGNANVDPTEIQQIIMNLCSNAVWAMKEKGTIKISLNEIKVTSSKEGEIALNKGRYIELIFSDTGVGMDDETKSKIFDPFFTRKDTGEGTGMGLSIIYSIMDSYGGTITVESEVGKGATFHLFFPVTHAPVIEESKPEENIPTGQEHILLVDDQKMVAQTAKKIISRLGYTVDVFIDSLKALDSFRGNPGKFDLVITDQIMPGLSGEELAQNIRSIKPDMPIILCTGYSTQINEEKAASLGINAFAYKPMGRKDMAKLIRKVLDEK